MGHPIKKRPGVNAHKSFGILKIGVNGRTFKITSTRTIRVVKFFTYEHLGTYNLLEVILDAFDSSLPQSTNMRCREGLKFHWHIDLASMRSFTSTSLNDRLNSHAAPT